MKRSELESQFRAYLILRNYRPQTINSYCSSLKNFIEFSVTNSCSDWDLPSYAKAFLVQRFNKGCAWSSVNIDYSALRLLFTHVLKKDWDYNLVPRPRGRPSLPFVLSGRQVEAMINNLANLKHKTIVTTMYTTGIRIGELINLEVSHILLERAQLKVVNGKGGKDRIIALPATAVDMISSYLSSYKPKQMFIEGNSKGKRYSCSSVRKIIKRTARKAGVQSKVSPHSLRHAYATHHIENGTDLVSLQQQLGHARINTTIKYVKLCKLIERHISHPIQKLSIDLPKRTI